ncbi:transcriptional regulator FilR1 domain-containing protein [Halorubrum tropicale]
MAPQSPSDLADTLLKRYECLRALFDQPRQKRDLVDEIGIPRSTLDDIVRELEAADLVVYRDSKWQLTLFGQYMLKQHINYKEGLESLTNVIPIIKELPRDTPVERRFLRDVEVYIATTPVPDGVMQVFLDAVESATHVRGVTPLAMAGYDEPFYRAATSGSDAQLEVVLPLETFERLRTLHPDSTAKAMNDDDTTLYHADIPVTFSLWIADDDHTGLIVYADQGVQGILINDTNDALDWATNQYDRIRKDAEKLFYRGSARRSAGFS